MRTYSRRSLVLQKSNSSSPPPAKRRRLGHASSSATNESDLDAIVDASSTPAPSSPFPVFSDPVGLEARDSTPPSSPLADVDEAEAEPIEQTTRPAFSFSSWRVPSKTSRAAMQAPRPSSPTLKGEALDGACDNVIHKSPEREMLDDTRNNVVYEPLSSILPDSTKEPQKPKLRRTRLTQMTIDLGGPVQKRCRVCGMEYIPSNAEDSALHKKFHAQNLGGIELGKGFVESVRAGGGIIWTGDDETCVAVVEKKDTLGARGAAMKRRVGDVLEVVRTELGAVEIAESELWSSVSTKEALDVLAQGDRVTTSEAVKANRFGRFKIYLYLHGSKCIGVCLAERISHAYKVLETDDQLQGAEPTAAKPDAVASYIIMPKNSAISIAKKPDDAMLGISRIWTSTSYRKQGIATTLLDCAADNFLYGLRVDKQLIAFSQPTESGGCLARRWLATKNGWHVYTE